MLKNDSKQFEIAVELSDNIITIIIIIIRDFFLRDWNDFVIVIGWG